MSNDEQLAWEARAGKPAAVAAFAAALMSLAAGVYLRFALEDTGSGADEALRSADRESTDFIVAGALQALALLLLVPVLLYLYRAARHRREQTAPAIAYLAVLGAVTLAAVTILRQLQIIDIAHDFFPEKANAAKDPEEAAEDEIRENISPAIEGLGLGGGLAFAFGVVMVSVNAMRAGLLSRFMGILGIFAGLLMILPIEPIPVIRFGWLAALGLLLLGKWPGGRGPAWQTGEAIPWPGAAEQREEIIRRREEREGVPEAPPGPQAEPEEPRPASRKRKKKRR